MTGWATAAAVLAGLGLVDLLLASRIAARRLPRCSRNSDGAVRGPLAWALAGLVRLYRAGWSARNAGLCRFEPSCSAYALAAVHRHGGVRGGALAVRRLLRCQPLSPGGYDPVPGTDPSPRTVRNPERFPPGTGPSLAVPGTDPSPAIVRKSDGMMAVLGEPTSDGRAPRDVRAAGPVHRHGSSSPIQGTRAEIVGSGRGPWV